ncbi:transposase, partial [Novacetimonas pomaceti]|uniref:transposase n=1 Tax=Novacetimonas pomaceti TaxID=2021998 RepID=UPI001EEFF8EC
MGRSRGGRTTMIHMLADTQGRPLRFIITAGQVGDVTQAQALLAGQKGAAVIADKAYDSNALRALVAQMIAEVVIPCNRTRKIIVPHDTRAYKLRNRIERGFNRLPDQQSVPAHKILETATWRRVSWRRGTKGGRTAQHMPGEEAWLIGEHRSTGERKYYLSNLS